MPTSSNFEATLEIVAPAGGATAGTMLFISTQKMVVLPLTTATSGNKFTGKVVGLVRSVPKVTGAAWQSGRALTWTSTKFKVCTGSVSQANAAADQVAGDTTADVILRLPCTGVA